jgi:hypothetical protein
MNANFLLILDNFTQTQLADVISAHCDKEIIQGDISKMSNEPHKLVDKRKATIEALNVIFLKFD